MTPTLVLVLTYFSLAICAVLFGTLMRLPLLLSSVACRFAREGDGRHRRHGPVARAEARS
jgi:hypothetical protein